MCEASVVPKIGHKIESMEFLESLGKVSKVLSVSWFSSASQSLRKVFKNCQKQLPKTLLTLKPAHAGFLLRGHELTKILLQRKKKREFYESVVA